MASGPGPSGPSRNDDLAVETTTLFASVFHGLPIGAETLAGATGGSACGELRLAEIILPLGVGNRPLPRPVGQYGDAALHRGPRRHFVVPALYRRILGEIDVPPLRAPDPREGND